MGSEMADPLEGKRALVCGGSQGIGRACAFELARLGAEVTLAARGEEALHKTSSELPAHGRRNHRYIRVDFGDPSVLEREVAAHAEATGPMHILVNNTGGPAAGPLVDAKPDAFLGAFSNHVLCNQLLAQALLPGMKQAGYGRIINIISTSVLQPIKGLGVSNTIRGAVANWGRTLAGELACMGITVNNVLPGYTATAHLRLLLQATAEKRSVTLEKVEGEIAALIPMGRFGAPEEIAAVVGFLASPLASYVTGVNLPVDGGRMAGQ